MKYIIVFPEKIFSECRRFLLRDLRNEQFGYLLAGINQDPNSYMKLLVHRFIPAQNPEDLEYQSVGGICPSAKFQMRVYSMCKKEGHHLIDVHSHPFDSSENVRFSGIDDRYEIGDGRSGVFGFTAMWNPGMCHASIVFGQKSLDARIYRSELGRAVPIDAIQVLFNIIPTSARLLRDKKGKTHLHEVGKDTVTRVTSPADRKGKKKDVGDGFFSIHDFSKELYSRQILAFGKSGQEALASTTVAVIGAGGISSIVVEVLARIGVKEIICVDNDVIEASNLSRVVGSYWKDTKKRIAKVKILERHSKSINPNIIYTPIIDTVLSPKVLKLLKRADVIISGTDTYSSRIVLNQLAVQYLIPYIDLGFGMETDNEQKKLMSAGGKIITFIPGNWCFNCLGEINQRELQLELMSEEDRDRQVTRGYISGIDMPNPSVIFLNMIVASLGICEFLNLLVPFKKRSGYIFYDMLSTKLWNMEVKQKTECPICCPEAEILGRGDALILEDIRSSEVRDIPGNI